jgi:hypothetical protein
MPKRLTNKGLTACSGLALDFLTQAISDLEAGDEAGFTSAITLAKNQLIKVRREAAKRGHGRNRDGAWHADRWVAKDEELFEAALSPFVERSFGARS